MNGLQRVAGSAQPAPLSLPDFPVEHAIAHDGHARLKLGENVGTPARLLASCGTHVRPDMEYASRCERHEIGLTRIVSDTDFLQHVRKAGDVLVLSDPIRIVIREIDPDQC
jgi:hypothetical protein